MPEKDKRKTDKLNMLIDVRSKSLSKECEKQKKEQFGNYADQRYIFIPVDWRTSLTLDDGVIESITPKSIQTIRDKLNASLLDIMYYTSPLFKIEVNINDYFC